MVTINLGSFTSLDVVSEENAILDRLKLLRDGTEPERFTDEAIKLLTMEKLIMETSVLAAFLRARPANDK